jgi:hypothetical protein
MQRNRFPKHNMSASLFAAGARFAVLSAAAQIDTGEPQILSAGQLNATLAPNGAHVQPLDPNWRKIMNTQSGRPSRTLFSR